MAFYDPAPTPTPHTIPTPYSKKPSQTPNDRLLHTNIIRNLWLLKDWYDRVSPADIIISPVSHHQLILVLYQISGISVPSNLGLCVQWGWKNRTNLIVLPLKFIFCKKIFTFPVDQHVDALLLWNMQNYAWAGSTKGVRFGHLTLALGNISIYKQEYNTSYFIHISHNVYSFTSMKHRKTRPSEMKVSP